MEEVLRTPLDRKQDRAFILGSLSFGHGIAHLYDQGLPIIMPAIASSLVLSNLQVAVLLGIRQAGFGGVNLGAGVFVDMVKNQWGLILTACMVWSAIAYMAVGASPNFALLVIAVAFVSIPGALWHLPATAALSRRFPDRRGFAISMHGFGSNIGNVLGPILAGALLSVLIYRTVLFIYAVPALLVAFFIWWSREGRGQRGRTIGADATGSPVLGGQRDHQEPRCYGVGAFRGPAGGGAHGHIRMDSVLLGKEFGVQPLQHRRPLRIPDRYGHSCCSGTGLALG